HRTANGQAGYSSEVALLLLAFHGGTAVVVNEAAASLGELALRSFPDDSGKRHGAAFDRAGERIAAKRPESHGSDLRLLTWFKRQAMVVDHDQRAAAADDGAGRREIQRHHRDALAVDVEPHIELGPVGQWKHPQALALALAAVVEPPGLGTLAFGVPAVLRVAQ